MDIRRIRVIPKRYVFTGELEAIAIEMLDLDMAKVHMYLSQRFGMPDTKKEVGFYLNYKDVVFHFYFFEGKVCVGAYIAPRYKQAADRKKVKMRNIVARQLNIEGKPFVEDGKAPEDLYFSVRQKNDVLFKKALEARGDTEEVREDLEKECWAAVYDKLPFGVLRYCPELEEVARELFNDFKTTAVMGTTL
jgi:hypothetical protein